MSDSQPTPQDEARPIPSISEITEYGKTHTPEEMETFWRERVYQGDRMPQFTLRAVLTGGLLGGAMSIAHVYTTVKLGWSFGVAITASVLSFLIWRGIGLATNTREMSILETNCMQSTASAAGYSTGSTLVTAFGAMLLITGEHYPWHVAAVWTFLTALLGTAIAIPMKRQMINREQLPFPSGIAAAETLKALYGRGADAFRKAMALVWSLVIGMVLAFLRTAEWQKLVDWKIKIPELVPFGGHVRGIPSSTLPVFGFEPSLLLIGAGMITGLRVSLSMLAGSCLLYFAIGPMVIENDRVIMEQYAQTAASPDKPVTGEMASVTDLDTTKTEEQAKPADGDSGPPFKVVQESKATAPAGPILSIPPRKNPETGEVVGYPLTRWSLWAGTSLMVMASLTSVALQWRTMARAFKRTDNAGAAQDDGIEVPSSWFWKLFLPIAALTVLAEWYFFEISLLNGTIAIVLSVALSLVACRATGETDTNPVGAMGKIAQLLYAVLSPKNVQVNLMTASIAANAASSSADLLTDLKSGYLLGANPRKQILAQLVGVFFGTLTIIPAWYLMIPNKEALEKYNPPATNMWKAVAELLTKGVDQLPQTALYGIIIGGAIGIILPILDRLLPPNVKRFMPSAMGLGLGWIVPFANSFSFAIGAVIAWAWEKGHKRSAEDYNVPIASGFVAGESLMSAAIAMFQTISDVLAKTPES